MSDAIPDPGWRAAVGDRPEAAAGHVRPGDLTGQRPDQRTPPNGCSSIDTPNTCTSRM